MNAQEKVLNYFEIVYNNRWPPFFVFPITNITLVDSLGPKQQRMLMAGCLAIIF